MAGSTLGSWDALFKDDYAPAFVNTLNEERQMQNFMTKELTDDSWVGRQKVIPVKLGRNMSVGSIGAGGALPIAGRSTWGQFKVPMKDIYTRVGFEKWVMKQSRSKKGAWAQVVSQEMDGAVQDLLFRRNVMAWLTGHGILALVNGAQTADVTIEVDSPGNVAGATNGNRYLFGDTNSGMYVHILNASTQAIEGQGTITGYAAAGTTFTSDTAITCTDNAYVVMAQNATQNSYTDEPEGLLAAIDDGTYYATYHNLSRTTYPQLKGHITSSVGALSPDAIQQNIDATSIRVGKTVDLLACEHSVRRAFLALTELDRRYTGADLMNPDPGTKAAKKPSGRAVTYGDIPILADRDAPYGMLFGINKGSFVRYVEDEGSWSDDEGSVLKWVEGFDQYTAFFHVFENYHCHQPSRNFRMDGITVNQLAVHAF